MATLTLSSPGVQIVETDQSAIARTNAGTNIFMTGFAPQGLTDELINIGSVSEFESTFGTPTNEAERYLYHSAKQVLQQSPGNLIVSRMPYGEGPGNGFANSYSALIFPVRALSSVADTTISITSVITGTNQAALTAAPVSTTVSLDELIKSISTVTAITTSLSSGIDVSNNPISVTIYTATTTVTSVSSGHVTTYKVDGSSVDVPYSLADKLEILSPTSVLLSDELYQSALSNDIDWLSTHSDYTLTDAEDLKYGGIVVLNPTKLSTDNLYQGSYIAFADNVENNPGSDFNSVTGVKVVNQVIDGTHQNFTSIPTNRLNFALSSSYLNTAPSVSRLIEQVPNGYDFSSSFYNDCLTLVELKVATSVYDQDTVTLNYQLKEAYTGSLYRDKTQNNSRGGSPVSFALEKLITSKNSDLKVLVNPNISSSGEWTNPDGTPKKLVRVSNAAKNLYSLGVYVSNTDVTSTDLGNVPLKLQRILNRLDDLDVDVDILP